MFENSIRDRVRSYVKTNYLKLPSDDFKLGEINYTHRCHLNAVQKVKEGQSEKVFSCIAIDKDTGWLCVHFINKDKDGKYVDHTWGWMQQHYHYYLIREIEEYEQDTVWDILTQTKESLFNLHTNWFHRLVAKIDF